MRRLVFVAFLAIMLLSACDLQQNIADRSDVGGTNPQVAPAFSGKVVGASASADKQFSLAGAKGSVVMLDFWGSWCGPCRQEQPDFNTLAAAYEKRGVIVVGVAMRDDLASVRAYISSNNVPYGTIMDDDQSISGDYNIASPPTTVVIDATGHIAQRYLGTTAGIADELDTLLAHR